MSDSGSVDVSVVVPCYNHGQFVREAIASAEASRGTRFEIIVVDDGSTDPLTLDVMARLRRDGYQVIRHETNRGSAAARNTGISCAGGRYILPLDADNRIRTDYLRLGVAILDHAPRVGVVYGDVEFFGEATGPYATPEFAIQRLLLDNIVDTCAVFRRAIWEECGGYDTETRQRGAPRQIRSGWAACFAPATGLRPWLRHVDPPRPRWTRTTLGTPKRPTEGRSRDGRLTSWSDPARASSSLGGQLHGEAEWLRRKGSERPDGG